MLINLNVVCLFVEGVVGQIICTDVRVPTHAHAWVGSVLAMVHENPGWCDDEYFKIMLLCLCAHCTQSCTTSD